MDHTILVNSTVSEQIPEDEPFSFVFVPSLASIRLCNACGLHYSKILKKERSNASKGNGAIKVNNLLNPPSDDSSESDPQPTPFHPQPNIQRMTFQMQQTPTVYNFHSYTPQPAPNNSPVNNTHHQLPSNPMNPNFKMQRISQPIPKPPDVNTDLTRQDFIARQLPPNPNASQNASIIIHPPLQSWKQ